MKTKEIEFARIVGRVPNLKSGQALIHAQLAHATQAFGPPEKVDRRSTQVLYWNFKSNNGAKSFSLWVELPSGQGTRRTVDFEVSTPTFEEWEPFFDWTMHRLGVISNDDGPPMFLNAARFVIVPA